MPADRIVQEIVLTGDAQLKARMDALGLSGTKAFNRIQAAADQAAAGGGIGGRLSSALAGISSRFGELASAASNVDSKFDTVVKSTDTFAKRIGIATGAVAGLAAGFVALALGSSDTTEEIAVNAKGAGLSTDNYQKLASAFDILGIGGDKVRAVFDKMNKSLDAQRKSALNQENQMRDLTDAYARGEVTAEQYLQRQAQIHKDANQSIDTFRQLGVTFEATGNDSMTGFNLLADAFARMPEGIEKSKAQLEIFGKTGTKVAAAFAGGSAGLAEIIAEGQRVGPALNPTILAIGSKLDDAFDKLQLALKNTKQQFTLLFGPSLTTLIDAVTNLIVKNRDTILQFGASIADALTPIINDISALISGDKIDPSGFVARARDAITQFATDVSTAVTLVIGAWNGLVAVMNVVAGVINAVFGTNVSGQALAIVAVLGVVTGAFSLIGTAIGVVISNIGLLDAALVLVFGPAGAALVGIAALGLAIGALIAQIPFVQEAFNALVQGFTGTVDNFKALFNLIGEAWSLLWTSASDFANGIFTKLGEGLDWLIDKAKAAASWVRSLGGGGGQQAVAGIAGGGRVIGPGTGTSDSILARLSRGEFVVRAAAVQRYGAGVFNALNQMRVPNPIGFAAGGLVDGLAGALNSALMSPFAMPQPALVNAGAGSTLNLTIGNETFAGLQTDDQTIDRLTRFAVRQQMRSPGRKPGWHR